MLRGPNARERDMLEPLCLQMAICRGGGLPSMAGSKFNIWQRGQIIKGDPGRGWLELPFWSLHVLVLHSIRGKKKKVMSLLC